MYARHHFLQLDNELSRIGNQEKFHPVPDRRTGGRR
jgi:hypothetical protein